MVATPPPPPSDSPVISAAWDRLATINDPELHVPITQLGMVHDVSEVSSSSLGAVLEVTIRLTIAGCPMRSTIHDSVERELSGLDGVAGVRVVLDVMTPEQRRELIDALRAGRSSNPFDPAQNTDGADQQTAVLAITSGKGGVGKSTVTANLAVALAQRGLRVGLIDADIHGFSIPGLLGVTTKPTRLDSMILPPVAHGVKVMSIGMFLDHDQPVAWRGPMLHRALEQFIKDVHWGELDALLIDLPPGTGDIAISVGQLLPSSNIVVVTTPQHAASHVAIRSGQLAVHTDQRVRGVIENMGPMTLPDGTVMDVFGAGGGRLVAEELSEVTGTEIPLIETIPLDPVLRSDGDSGTPTVLAHPESAGSAAFGRIVDSLIADGLVPDRPSRK